MPFVAKLVTTGERIDITRVVQPLTLRSQELVCQLCGSRMMVKAGQVRIPHFAHYATCDTTIEHQPESLHHLIAKQHVAKTVRAELKEYSHATVSFEEHIPEANRIADVLITYPDGWRVANECQLAATTTGELEERTRSYESAGVDVVWWLGKEADTEANHRWCINRFGFSLSLRFSLREQPK